MRAGAVSCPADARPGGEPGAAALRGGSRRPERSESPEPVADDEVHLGVAAAIGVRHGLGVERRHGVLETYRLGQLLEAVAAGRHRVTTSSSGTSGSARRARSTL